MVLLRAVLTLLISFEMLVLTNTIAAASVDTLVGRQVVVFLSLMET